MFWISSLYGAPKLSLERLLLDILNRNSTFDQVNERSKSQRRSRQSYYEPVLDKKPRKVGCVRPWTFHTHSSSNYEDTGDHFQNEKNRIENRYGKGMWSLAFLSIFLREHANNLQYTEWDPWRRRRRHDVLFLIQRYNAYLTRTAVEPKGMMRSAVLLAMTTSRSRPPHRPTLR